MEPRFQFTLRELLAATFWFSATATAWTLLVRGLSAYYPSARIALPVAILSPLCALAVLTHNKTAHKIAVVAMLLMVAIFTYLFATGIGFGQHYD